MANADASGFLADVLQAIAAMLEDGEFAANLASDARTGDGTTLGKIALVRLALLEWDLDQDTAAEHRAPIPGYVADVGYDPVTGKRRQRTKSGFKTKREAEEAVRAVLEEVRVGRRTFPRRRKPSASTWPVARASPAEPSADHLGWLSKGRRSPDVAARFDSAAGAQARSARGMLRRTWLPPVGSVLRDCQRSPSAMRSAGDAPSSGRRGAPRPGPAQCRAGSPSPQGSRTSRCRRGPPTSSASSSSRSVMTVCMQHSSSSLPPGCDGASSSGSDGPTSTSRQVTSR